MVVSAFGLEIRKQECGRLRTPTDLTLSLDKFKDVTISRADILCTYLLLYVFFERAVPFTELRAVLLKITHHNFSQ